MFEQLNPKEKISNLEEKILKFWEDNKIFEKSIDSKPKDKLFTFYDGPPFATGEPHYGHIVGSILKDVIPRYWTMKGYRVYRVWGWDCHGLPIENIAEKDLNINSKKEIENIGVEKFNNYCRSKVLGYTDIWKKTIKRLGRWVDMDNPYMTMSNDFMESVWWVFKQMWDKGLIYYGYKSIHICPRCETTLSQQEVSEGYKDIKDLSATVKFKIKNTKFDKNTYILAWTTTPWTLIGNVALAINQNADYVSIKIKDTDEIIILAKDRIDAVLKNIEYEIIDTYKGIQLINIEYEPLFDYYAKDENLENKENGWKIYHGDFVTMDSGTGIVHIAPAFGEDDMILGQSYKLPFIQHVHMNGTIHEKVIDFAGLSVKPKDDHQKTDIEIIKYLAHKNMLFAKEKYEHSYPHCWRCDTPLINYATTSWFVNVLKIKEKSIQEAQKINWVPSYIKEGRFGNWLNSAKDWSISRQRYWATPIPIWKCNKCENTIVVESKDELKKYSKNNDIEDLHKHIVDNIKWKCDKCNDGEMTRIPDVFDCWFDSGSMPYAQIHYPFENKDKFKYGFPADFIAEGIDQTRAWFYYLHIIAVALFDNISFKNVIVNGIVQAEDGKKMSKRLKNYPDPNKIIENYGADCMRFYIMQSPVVYAETLNFSEKEIAELSRNMFRMLINTYSFFTTYANIDKINIDKNKEIEFDRLNILDKWIISKLQILINDVDTNMEKYEVQKATRFFPKFIDDLSNWYIRRSRKRFWKSEYDDDKINAYNTLYYVLVELSRLLAPITPFISEEIYKNLTKEESVHLTNYPIFNKKYIDKNILLDMDQVREIVNIGLQKRSNAKIKVRQPLHKIIINKDFNNELKDIIKDELNVKEILIDTNQIEKIEIDTNITQDLLYEGYAREIIRLIQELRKSANYNISDRIQLYLNTDDPDLKNSIGKFNDMIQKETLSAIIASIDNEDKILDTDIDNKKLIIKIRKNI